jgi:hypothetical protein
VCEQLKFVSEKVKADQTYAKTLRRLVRNESLLGGSEPLALFEEKGESFAAAVQAFSGLHDTLAINTEIFAAKVQEQIVNPLTAMRDKLSAQYKKLTADGQAYAKALKTQTDALAAAKVACKKACEEARTAKLALDKATKSQPVR